MTRAAELHVGARLTPSKIELLQAWLPTQRWFFGDPATLQRAAGFRLLDPDGEVGLDCMVISAGGEYYFVPVTWRAAPLDGVQPIGTLQHSELGLRYCYDAATDPVFVDEASRIIREADHEADLRDAHGAQLPITMTADGTGALPGEGERLEVMRLLIRAVPTPDNAAGSLIGRWTDHEGPRHDVLAILH
ncbi:1,4-alpha-glucan branching protein [Tessaracoccus sp. MC1679]|uniref:maltokinase N-terminal cap-like domain-containing protein n=1 Tax=Tessaracoccus sp. MC1679 TaxID=2760313 RepID=UPI0015FEBA71|nr:1,4-alpha-glucan branching protein [Tessaracoccus sp. MC1679]